MPKARRVLAALRRDGWVVVHVAGSHKRMEKNGVRATFAFHDSMDLGNVQLAQVADDFGYSRDQLRALL